MIHSSRKIGLLRVTATMKAEGMAEPLSHKNKGRRAPKKNGSEMNNK